MGPIYQGSFLSISFLMNIQHGGTICKGFFVPNGFQCLSTGWCLRRGKSGSKSATNGLRPRWRQDRGLTLPKGFQIDPPGKQTCTEWFVPKRSQRLPSRVNMPESGSPNRLQIIIPRGPTRRAASLPKGFQYSSVQVGSKPRG